MDADKKIVVNKAPAYLHLIQRLAMLLYNSKLYYGLNNPRVMQELSEVFAEIENLTSKKTALTFSAMGNTMFVNGEKLEIRDGLSRQFLLSFAKLSLGALDLRHNPTEEKSADNAVPSPPAMIKPAEEGKIISPALKDAALKSDAQGNGRPALEVVRLFSADLGKGVIRDRLLMRDPIFLCEVLTHLTQAINTMEELAGIIRTIGEFIIDDISSVKEIEAKRKICEQLNNHLAAQWERKESKEQGRKIIEEAFVRIVAVLQVKKYMLAYIKHKKGLEVALKKIKNTLKDAPEDNVLYRQIKNELRKIGAPKYDGNMFA